MHFWGTRRLQGQRLGSALKYQRRTSANGDWTSTVKRSGEDSAEREQEAAGTKRSHSAPTKADSSYRAKQEPGGPAATKTEPAAGPVVPRGSVLLQPVAFSSAAVQTAISEDALWGWLATSTATTTATQTSTIANDVDSNPNVHIFHYDVDGNPKVNPETFQQWRGIHGKYLLELHKLQQNSQRTMDQIWDPRQPLPARIPTSVLEQLRTRIKIITDDMTSIARSCCMEMAAGSALLSSPERRVVQLRPPTRRRKPAHRRRKRVEKRACGDTMEESIFSTPPPRKRVQTYKGFPSNPFSNVTLTNSCHFHIVDSHWNNTTLPSATLRQTDNSSQCTPPHARVSTNLCVTHSLRLLPGRALKGMVGTQEFALVRQ